MIRLFSQALRWRENRFALLLFSVALLTRVYYQYEISHHPLFNYLILDAEFHDRWAQSIAGGNFLGDTVFFRAPFYPYFLGAIYFIFGHNFVIPRILQHLLGTVSVVLLYFLARRLFGHKIAAIASLLYAVYPIIFYFEDQLLMESIINFQVILLFTIIPRDSGKSTISRWFVIGLILGTICITRPTFLPLYLLLLGYLWWGNIKTLGGRNIIKLSFGLTLGLLVIIIPIAMRNYLVGNDSILIASQGGINFYIGNNAQANGYSSMLPTDSHLKWEYRDIESPVVKELGRIPKPSEMSNYWYSQGMHFITSQPGMFLKLLAKKIYVFWNKFEVPNNQSFYSFVEHSSLLRWVPIGFWCIGPLGLLGMIISWKYQRARLPVLFVILYSFIVIAFFVCDRFRLPILPFLCIFSGVAATRIWEGFQEKKFAFLSAHLPMLFVFVAFTNSNIFNFQENHRKIDLLRMGNAALEQKNYSEAVSYFDQCAREPGIVQDVYLNWGAAEWGLNSRQEAIKKFRRELEYFPRSYDALANLAHAYLLQGMNESTLVYATKAIRTKPYASAAYIDEAMAYNNLQMVHMADSILSEGRKNCGPGFIYGESVLAGIHILEGHLEVAEHEYRSILRRLKVNGQPDYKPEYRFSENQDLGDDFRGFKAKIYYSLGHIFDERNEPDSSAYYFEMATDQSPDFSEAWIDLGISLHDLQKFSDADKAFKHGIQLSPNNFIGWYNYGLLLVDTGELSRAASAFKNALRIKSDFTPARDALSSIDLPQRR